MQIGTNNAMTQRKWRKGITHEAELQCVSMGFVAKDDLAAVYLLDDLTKERGDKIQTKFSPTDDAHDGFGDDDNIEGNEEVLEALTFELTIDYLALAFKQKGQMSQQRVNFDLKKAAFTKLATKWARRWEQVFFNQLCGYTPAMGAAQDNFKRTGNQTVNQYDATHTHRPAGIAADESLTSSHPITLTLLDEVLVKCMSKRYLTYPITPCVDGYYHLFISPRQWKTLRINTTAGQWEDIQRAQIEGGKPFRQSGFAKGYVGIWNQIKIHTSDYVTYGVNSGAPQTAVTTADRAVLVGARAAHMAFGEGYASDDHLDWVEQVRNYKKWGVLADSVFGFKRTEINLPESAGGALQTYGSFVIPTYEV